MDIIAQILEDPRYKEFHINCITEALTVISKTNTEKVKQNDILLPAEAKLLLSANSRPIGDSTLAKYRGMGLHFIPGKPHSYLRAEVIRFRNEVLTKNKDKAEKKIESDYKEK